MRKNDNQRTESELLPFHIIKAASEGDVEAINAVLKHYEGYQVCLPECYLMNLDRYITAWMRLYVGAWKQS